MNMPQFSAVFMVASSAASMLFCLSLGSSVSMPDSAKVVIDMDEALYFAPSCPMNHAHQLLHVSVRRAREMGFKADIQRANSGAFRQQGRSIVGNVLEWAGLLSPLRARWNADGSWNW